MNRTAIYARVSTNDQDYEMQVEELRRIASQSKWEVVGEYTEKVSGAKSRGKRPELDRLLKDIHKRKIDNVMVWKLDRLGRSLVDLIHIIDVCEEINQPQQIVCYSNKYFEKDLTSKYIKNPKIKIVLQEEIDILEILNVSSLLISNSNLPKPIPIIKKLEYE